MVLLLEPGRAVGADGGVVIEVFGEDGLGGGDVCVQDGFLGFGVGETLHRGGVGVVVDVMHAGHPGHVAEDTVVGVDDPAQQVEHRHRDRRSDPAEDPEHRPVPGGRQQPVVGGHEVTGLR